MRRIRLQYGTTGLELLVDAPNVTVLEPGFIHGLPDEHAAFCAAVRRPLGGRPLRQLVGSSERLAIVIPDITRPLPSDRLLPWLLAELDHVAPDRITIINGTGSHRANTPAELERMVGHDVVRRYRIVNHDAQDALTLRSAGRLRDGCEVRMNRDYLEADRRIVLGFIEPHFMAGFSGGYKGIFPAVASMDAILHYHRAEIIAHPHSTWGVLEGNPTQALIREAGSLVPVDFCINVTLNKDRAITAFFCGETLAAHAAGCEFARSTAMIPFDKPFPIVVTTNGGYPLDQNLYQAVKGMSAAAQVVCQGGVILAVARCNDGFPAHGNFKKLLFEHATPQAILDTVLVPGFRLFDQWEAQLLANILLKARVGLHSEIPDEEVRRGHLDPVGDVSARLREEILRFDPDVPIAVLPEGPMTIPYLKARAVIT